MSIPQGLPEALAPSGSSRNSCQRHSTVLIQGIHSLMTYLVEVGSYYGVQDSLTVCSVHHNKGGDLWGGAGSTGKAPISTRCCRCKVHLPVTYSLPRGSSPPNTCLPCQTPGKSLSAGGALLPALTAPTCASSSQRSASARKTRFLSLPACPTP